MMSKEEQTKSEKQESCVRIFFPDESEPSFEYEPDCNTSFVVNQICEELEVKGCLKMRNKTARVGNVILKAGDYDFHIIEKTPPQQGK
jgi:hypothetical protein